MLNKIRNPDSAIDRDQRLSRESKLEWQKAVSLWFEFRMLI
jgi:hypothetical protein